MATRKRSGRKSATRKYGRAAGKSVERAMRRRKRGTLRSGKAGRGGKAKSRKQAIAIGLAEARKKGAKVPGNREARLVARRRRRWPTLGRGGDSATPPPRTRTG